MRRAQLPEAFNLVVATHVSLCDECRARVASRSTRWAATLLEDADEIAMGEDALAKRLERIEGLPQATRTEPLQAAGDLPGPSGRLHRRRPVFGALAQGRRRGEAGDPAHRPRTPRCGCCSSRRAQAVPDHGHRGMELTLVLQGAFADANDRFDRGDIEIADEETWSILRWRWRGRIASVWRPPMLRCGSGG